MKDEKNGPNLKGGQPSEPDQPFFSLARDVSSPFDHVDTSVLKVEEKLSYYNKVVIITTDLDTGEIVERLEISRSFRPKPN